MNQKATGIFVLRLLFTLSPNGQVFHPTFYLQGFCLPTARLLNSSPLFEEKRHFGLQALISNIRDPFHVKHKSSIVFPSVIILAQSSIQTPESEIINAKIFLPGNHPQTPGLLGSAWMPDYPALLHPGGRRDDEPCHLPARARSRALERGVCGAVCPPR